MMPRLLLLMLLALAGSAFAAGTNELSANDLAAARKLYVAKCAKCHAFYDPKAYSKTEWPTWLEKMSQKSKLKTDQADLLKRYLDEYRAGRLAGKPEAKP